MCESQHHYIAAGKGQKRAKEREWMGNEGKSVERERKSVEKCIRRDRKARGRVASLDSGRGGGEAQREKAKERRIKVNLGKVYREGA